MAMSVGGPKNVVRVRYPARRVDFQNVKDAKQHLERLLNNSDDPNAPKYSVSFVREGRSFTLQVRTKHKKDLGFVDQFLERGSLWGFKVKKAAVQYKLRME